MDAKDIIKLYLGQYAIHGDKRINVCGLNVNSDKIQNIIGEEYIPISEIKLLLRPLSSMTEEEMEEFGVLIQHRELCRMDSGWKLFKGTPENFRWLLSKGFDLFNLIQEGHAIDISTLKKQNNGEQENHNANRTFTVWPGYNGRQ